MGPSSEATPASITASTLKPSPDATLVPRVAWEPCEEPFECTSVSVPLDYDAPHGEEIELALIRLPAPAAARRIGSLLVNPGGPGVSGVDFVRHAAVETIPAELRARFDIVGFDPRGVGASHPVTCEAGSASFLSHDLAPDDAAEAATVLAAADAFAASCHATSGELLRHVGTADVVHDLDEIRTALGDARLTYVGYSYGTRIGVAYAERFPAHVRALVLDGAVDPTLDHVEAIRAQAVTLEGALEEFLTGCAADPTCPLPPDRATATSLDALLADLDGRALPAPQLGPDQQLAPGQAEVAVVAMLRDRETWPLLQVALAAAWEGDGSWLAAPLTATVDPAGGELVDGMAALMAVNCVDIPVPPADDLPAVAADLATTAPRFGPVLAYLHAPCSSWPVPAVGTPQAVSAAGTPPIVVVGNRGDIVTPFAWSQSLAAQLDNGVLLTRDGDRHTAFGGDNVCTDRAVIRYLIDLIPPDPTRSCG